MMPPLLADVIWPSLYVTEYFYASWAVLVGLACECLVFRFWLRFSWKRAALAAVVVNALSGALGIILIPISGLAWELTGGQAFETFGPTSWAAAWVLAVLVNAVVEFWPLVWPFRAPRTWRVFGIVVAANALSVGFAFVASLFMKRPTM
jgi:hypothetical protein